MVKVFCLLLAFVAVALAVTYPSTFNIDLPGNGGGVTVKQGLSSGWIFIESSDPPESTCTLSWTDPTGTLGFTSSSFTFSPTARSTSFRINNAPTNGTYTITFTSSDTTQFTAPADIGVAVVKRLWKIEMPTNNVMVGDYSEPISIWLSEPATTALTFTPQTKDRSHYLEDQIVNFNPGNVVINAGDLVGSFQYWGTNATSSLYISWDVSGGDAQYYEDGYNLNGDLSFALHERRVTIPSFGADGSMNVEAVLGDHGESWLYVYVQQRPNSSFTITPNAADTTFNPSQLSIDSTTNWVRFSYITTSPEPTKIIYWTWSNTDSNNYMDIGSTTISVPKRSVNIVLPSTLVQTNLSWFSVAIPYPTMQDLTVSFYASQCTFPVQSVTFTSTGNETAFNVPIMPTNLGNDAILFKLTGTDADYYSTLAPQPLAIGGGQFVSPNDWYVPTLYIGEQSPLIPVRASFSASSNGVTLTPSAPNLRFDPSTLTFKNGSDLQWFRITPLYTDAVDMTGTLQVPVNFLVSGADYSWFTTPASFSVNVQRRVIQTHWSGHLGNQWLTRFGGSAADRHLGKTYPVWVTANYVGTKDEVTVTPVSPYFSFNPRTIKFSTTQTRVLLQATVLGVVGNTAVDYIIGGKQGGYYAPIASDSVKTLLRPLEIQAAVIAPDTRLPHKKAGLVDWPDFSAQTHLNGLWTVYSFKIRSSVLPDGGLTITPVCPHAKFSPSSIKLGGSDAAKVEEYDVAHDLVVLGYDSGNSNLFNPLYPKFTYYMNNSNLYLEANFTVQPQAGGNHLVNFVLTGKDAGLYQNPGDTTMFFNTVNRDGNEPVQAAAGAVFPSIAVFVVAIISAMML